MEFTLKIQDLFEFLNATPSSRCINEGQAVLNAGHIILHGIEDKTDHTIQVYGLCLKSSGLRKDPHEIRLGFRIMDKNIDPKTAVCSCKAGNSSRCKHIAALLFLCTREKLTDFDFLSSTDVSCKWKETHSKTVDAKYGGIPFEDYPCIKKVKLGNSVLLENMDVSDKKEMILKKLCAAAPNSALAKHRTRQRQMIRKEYVCDIEPSEQTNKICEHASNAISTLTATDPKEECCKTIYATLIPENCSLLAEMTKNDKLIWHYERKYRITGSRCYDLFTYSKGDWEKKCVDYLNPKKLSNRFVLHGIQNEGVARGAYISATESSVAETGLIVSKKHPWMGYSPDGVILDNHGVPIKLLEIKCPYIGKEASAEEFYKVCNYLTTNENNEVVLRKKHKYYGQIQFGMAIMNLRECDIIFYSTKFNNMLILTVQQDEVFTTCMLDKLHNVYFNYMLPQFCKITKQSK